MHASAPISLSLRETRLLLERIFQHLGVQDCLLHSVKDAAMYSVALEISRFEDLFGHFDQVADFAPERMRIVDNGAAGEPSLVTLDASGQHAWIVAEPALALLVAGYRQHKHSIVVVRNATAPRELAVIRGLAEKYQVSAELRDLADGAVEIVARPSAAAEQTLLVRIQHEGLPADYGTWERLLDLSKKALAPDSPLSRTHNGDIIVRPDGTIIGRRDEEFSDMDPKLLLEGVKELQGPDKRHAKNAAAGKR